MACLGKQHVKVLTSLVDLFSHEAFADTKIQLSDRNAAVPAVLVAALSPSFENDLSSDAHPEQNNVYDLSNISHDIWTAVFLFYYKTRQTVTGKNVSEISTISARHQLSELEEYCDMLESAWFVLDDFDGSLQRRILSTLLDFQLSGKFCDLELHLQDARVRAVGPMMAAMSDMFFVMLTTDMSEKGKKTVSLPSVSGENWRCINAYYYGSENLVTKENVLDILEISDMYCLGHLKEFCGAFLCSSLDMENCLDLSRVFRTFSVDGASRCCSDFMGKHFSEFSKTADFLKLKTEELMELLRNPDLLIQEDDLCSRLLSWIEAADADEDTVVQVLSRLMLHRLSRYCLQTELIPHSLVEASATIRALAKDELQRRHLPSLFEPDETSPHRRGHFRSAYDIVVIGSKAQCVMYCWSQEKKKWRELPGPTEPVGRFFATAVVKDALFVTGGQISGATHVFHATENEWRKGPDLMTFRCFHGMAVVEDTPYVVGGCTKDLVLTSSIEEYSECENMWREVGRLHHASLRCTVAAVGHTILVAYGLIRLDNELKPMIQAFNVRTRDCSVVRTSFTVPMCFVSSVSRCGDAWFACTNGSVVQVVKSADTFRVEVHTHGEMMSKFKDCCLYMDVGWMQMVGGKPTSAVQCICIHPGYRSQSDLSHGFLPLPVPLRVHGVYNLRVPSP